MTYTYQCDINAPEGWLIERPTPSSWLLQPEHSGRFAGDGLIPSMLVIAGPVGEEATPVGTVIDHIRHDVGEVAFRSSIGVGADEAVAFFQIVSTTQIGQHQLVATATACHHQAELVASDFDRLCAKPVRFEVVEAAQ